MNKQKIRLDVVSMSAYPTIGGILHKYDRNSMKRTEALSILCVWRTPKYGHKWETKYWINKRNTQQTATAWMNGRALDTRRTLIDTLVRGDVMLFGHFLFLCKSFHQFRGWPALYAAQTNLRFLHFFFFSCTTLQRYSNSFAFDWLAYLLRALYKLIAFELKSKIEWN